MKKYILTIAIAVAGVVAATGQSFTAPFSVLTSADGVDIYHVQVSVNITKDEILIGKKGSPLDIMFAHILEKHISFNGISTTYTTDQGTVVYEIEGDCHAITWKTPEFSWRIYSTLPEWVRVENK